MQNSDRNKPTGSSGIRYKNPIVKNINQFFSHGFGKYLKNNSVRTNKFFQKETIYKITKRIKGLDLNKGDYFYLDKKHKDHLEVFDGHGDLKSVINLDGSFNREKHKLAKKKGRNIRKELNRYPMTLIFEKIIHILKRLNDTSKKTTMFLSELIEFHESLNEFYEVSSKLQKHIEDFEKSPQKEEKQIEELLIDISLIISKKKSMLYELDELIRKMLIHYESDSNTTTSKAHQSEILNKLARIEKALAPLAYLKTKEEVFNFTSIYVLIKLSDGFLINDNYDGVMIINNDLSLRNKIPAFKQLRFDTWYNFKKFDLDEIIFFLNEEDDEPYLMHLNVTTKQYEKINYPTNIPEIYPEKAYYWNNDELIVHDDKNFYAIDCKQKVINTKPTKLIKHALPDFYNYYKESLDYEIVSAYPQEFVFIYRDRENHKIGIRNTKKNTTTLISFYDEFVFEIKKHDDYLMFIQRSKLDVRLNRKKRVEILPDPWHTFLTAEFVEIGKKLYIVGLLEHSSLGLSSSVALYHVVDSFDDF